MKYNNTFFSTFTVKTFHLPFCRGPLGPDPQNHCNTHKILAFLPWLFPGVKRFVIIYMELTLIFRCLLNVAKYVAYSQLIYNHHRASPWHWISENFLWKVIECVIHIMDIFLSLINEGFTFRTSRMAQIIEPMLVIQGMEM